MTYEVGDASNGNGNGNDDDNGNGNCNGNGNGDMHWEKNTWPQSSPSSATSSLVYIFGPPLNST